MWDAFGVVFWVIVVVVFVSFIGAVIWAFGSEAWDIIRRRR